MYDELIKRLRETSEWSNIKWEDYSDDAQETMREAADAIEKLQGKAKVFEKLADTWCEAVPKWIPVTERLPKYGTPVLAYGSRGGIFVAKYERARAEWDIDYRWKLNSSIHVCNPTHWMPLPQTPKGGK